MNESDILAIEPSIAFLRGKRLILANDLARIYGVESRTINQAEKRNGFPKISGLRCLGT